MALNPKSPLARLMQASVQPGIIEWLSVRPERRGAVVSVDEVVLTTDQGLLGDHYAGRSGARHVTLIGHEDLNAIASFMGRPVHADQLRRNVVTRGLNLLALKDRRFQLGSALLEYTGECHPCSRMEDILGIGGYNAVRGHGGITARVLQDGTVRLGDAILPAPQTNSGNTL